MSELCISPVERSRNAFTRVLQAVQAPGTQVAIAASLGASESTVSRIKTEKLQDALAFLYCAGFKVVTQGKVCVDGDALNFMRSITARVLSNEEQAASLFHGDE
jgi:hypothetical protein